MGTRKLLIIRFIAVIYILLSWSVSLADTTVVEVAREDFPYNQTTRIFVSEDVVYLECVDEYLKHGREPVDPERLVASFSKLLEWITLNREVKANVYKMISLNDYSATGYDFLAGAWGSFTGLDDGYGFAFISVGTSCMLSDNHLKVLIEGLTNNLESARSEDAQNKEDLFN